MNETTQTTTGKSLADADIGGTAGDVPIGMCIQDELVTQTIPNEALGRRMADRLREKGYHPVIIFGTTSSGKSTLLCSLFAYFMSDPNANIRFGEWIVPPDSPLGERQLSVAKRFFNHVVFAFMNGTGPDKTLDEFPFYIPVIVQPGDGLPEIKFAFLEGKGEWYVPSPKSDDYTKPLKQEISDVLFHFARGISVLHIAPISTYSGYVDTSSEHDDSLAREDSDLGLLGAIRAYNSVRTSKNRDHHLFLLTKWDLYAAPDADDSNFSHPNVKALRSLLNERFNKSWTAFQTMAKGGREGRMSYMQYCSGLISGKNVRRIDDDIKPTLHRYPRTVWNWLYHNATVVDDAVGKVLFSDVLPPPRKDPTIMDYILRVVGAK